jgi:hypothetical protein
MTTRWAAGRARGTARLPLRRPDLAPPASSPARTPLAAGPRNGQNDVHEPLHFRLHPVPGQQGPRPAQPVFPPPEKNVSFSRRNDLPPAATGPGRRAAWPGAAAAAAGVPAGQPREDRPEKELGGSELLGAGCRRRAGRQAPRPGDDLALRPRRAAQRIDGQGSPVHAVGPRWRAGGNRKWPRPGCSPPGGAHGRGSRAARRSAARTRSRSRGAQGPAPGQGLWRWAGQGVGAARGKAPLLLQHPVRDRICPRGIPARR